MPNMCYTHLHPRCSYQYLHLGSTVMLCDIVWLRDRKPNSNAGIAFEHARGGCCSDRISRGDGWRCVEAPSASKLFLFVEATVPRKPPHACALGILSGSMRGLSAEGNPQISASSVEKHSHKEVAEGGRYYDHNPKKLLVSGRPLQKWFSAY